MWRREHERINAIHHEPRVNADGPFFTRTGRRLSPLAGFRDGNNHCPRGGWTDANREMLGSRLFPLSSTQRS